MVSPCCEPLVDGDRQCVRVGVAGVYGCAGLVGDGRERLPVIGMAMGSQDGRDRRSLEGHQLPKPGRLVGGVDEQAFAGRGAPQQVGVVRHRPDGELGDGQCRQPSDVHGAADRDLAGVVSHDRNANVPR